tara:strand:- start:16 stop:402 length:387 start_codon:yes stop_codon:yes gene_type:complete
VTTSSPRSAFEQQLCSQLLSLSGVAEILADRVMALEARLAEVEGQQLADAADVAINDDADELLSASEEKVRMLRDRLAPVELAEPQPPAEETAEVIQLTPDNEDTAEQNASSDDTEYVDDPQIDLMTA